MLLNDRSVTNLRDGWNNPLNQDFYFNLVDEKKKTTIAPFQAKLAGSSLPLARPTMQAALKHKLRT